VIGYATFGQRLDLPALFGLAADPCRDRRYQRLFHHFPPLGLAFAP